MSGIETQDRVVGATGRNVLAELDQRVPTSFYWSLTLLATIGKISIGGYTGMAIAALLAAPCLLVLTGASRIVVVMVALNMFVASFAIGVGGTGWLIQGESFPTAIRGMAASIAAAVDWAANAVLVVAFPAWQTAIGLGWIMACFAALCMIAIVFIYRFLPETKGRSVEEITHVFEQQATQHAGVLVAGGGNAAGA